MIENHKDTNKYPINLLIINYLHNFFYHPYNSFLSIFKQLLNQAAVPIRPYFYKDILVEYLFYYLSEMSEINSISTKGSAGQVNISLTQSPNMRIALPPLNEQKRIVAKIEELFAVLDEIQKSIEA